MKSNYKKLGQYIKQVNVRDRNLTCKQLLGVSIEKKFIPSIANIIGTDMSTYKIVEKNQFAYGPVTSRNGDKISVALLEEYDKAIVSQAYTTFEIINTDELLPEYLMMWFRRSEFDRYSRFYSHGSAREIFDWDQMCEVELPVPDINVQRKIVEEYKTLLDRIDVNNQFLIKLEEAAKSIYKQWFIDFEFPDNKGKHYKSDGGKMKFVPELEKDIPFDWELITVKDFCVDMKSGGTPSRNNINYWNSEDIPWLKTGEIKNNIIIGTEEYISSYGLKNCSAKLLPKDTVLMSMYGVNAGDIGILKFEATTNQACCGMICDNPDDSAYLYYHLLFNQDFISSQSIGGAQENLSKDFIEKILIVKPSGNLLNRVNLRIIVDHKEQVTRENSLLLKCLNLLLSKLSTIEG